MPAKKKKAEADTNGAAEENGTALKRVKSDTKSESAAAAASAAMAVDSAATTAADGSQRPKDWPIADSRIPIDLDVRISFVWCGVM